MKNIMIMLILVVLVLTGCNSPTGTKKGVISGTVLLNGEEDHSGITILVYTGDIVPEEIKKINNDFPQIGFRVTDQHLFDHREYPVLHSTVTQRDGSYTLTEMQYGSYIIAFYKEGWGFNYQFDVVLDSNQLVLHPMKYLYPVTVMPNVVTNDYRMLSGHTYSFEQLTYFTETSSLVIEDGAVVIIHPNQTVIIDGEFRTFDDYVDHILITSADNIYSVNTPILGGGVEIRHLASPGVVSGLKLSHLASGLLVKKPNMSLQNILVMYNSGGVRCTESSILTISNSVFATNTLGVPALAFQNTSEILVEKNLFIDNYESVSMDLTTDGHVVNNYFIDGIYHVRSSYSSSATVEHNVFENADICISNSAKSNMTISNNEISGKTGIYLGRGDYNTVNQGWTLATNNNLSCSDYAVFSETRFYAEGAYMTLDFTNNYWGTTSSVEIDGLIWDYNDYSSLPDVGVWGKIIYSPFRSTAVTGAGIQTRI